MIKPINPVDLPHYEEEMENYIKDNHIRLASVAHNLTDETGRRMNSMSLHKRLQLGISSNEAQLIKNVVNELVKQKQQREANKLKKPNDNAMPY